MKQVLDLIAGQRDETDGGRAGVFGCADDDQEGVGEHGEGDPAGPGGVAAQLVLVQAGQSLLGLEGLLHPPP
ncbi:hypothetical protein HNR21_005176 [Actinomadura cellulosilytica]|uniref:Uncharacterized protein n=1 Tax=Thermomonospora cellulosilytica TaxID=1411118 RepID=A0A7W3N2E4_9ACTN|nr:hypothetical protein [Thermomonospora cellulosilytica]